ncbi:MAG: hypothetical protein RLZZ184_1570 [Cyanobacteriota bacterium]|jgi:hypothetical protein
MKRKTFKIGEYAIGGKIHIAYDSKQVIVRALEFKSNVVVSERVFSNTNEVYWLISDYLNELTSSYWAGVILEYIVANTNVTYEMFRGTFHSLNQLKIR